MEYTSPAPAGVRLSVNSGMANSRHLDIRPEDIWR